MRRTPVIDAMLLAACFATPLVLKAQAQTTPASAAAGAPAQAASRDPQTPEDVRRLAGGNHDLGVEQVKTFYLTSGSGPDYQNQILTVLRHMVYPTTQLYLVPELNAIVVRGTPDDLAKAQQLVTELDKPRPNYRLTYTIVESDGGKRLGVQHFALNMILGQRTTLKNGSKVPVATGSYSTSSSSSQTQFTYLDVGINLDATLTPGVGGLLLKNKIEQSSGAEDKLISGVNEPIIRQSVMEGSSFLTVGKAVTLGALDVAGSTRHLDVEVLLELVK